MHLFAGHALPHPLNRGSGRGCGKGSYGVVQSPNFIAQSLFHLACKVTNTLAPRMVCCGFCRSLGTFDSSISLGVRVAVSLVIGLVVIPSTRYDIFAKVDNCMLIRQTV